MKKGKVLIPAKHVDPALFQAFKKDVAEGKVKFKYLGSHVVKQGKDTIFMIASMHDKGQEPRTWGFVKTEKEARQAVAENAGDMCENKYYQYAVIEKLWSGIFCTHSEVIGWYRWFGSASKGSWEPVMPPTWSQGIINWTL